MEGCQDPTLKDRWMLSTIHSLLKSKENKSPVKPLITSFTYISGVFFEDSMVFGSRQLDLLAGIWIFHLYSFDVNSSLHV